MPRRGRMMGGGGASSAAVPKPIHITKPTVNFAGLVGAYDWMPVDKAISYHMAFEWYSRNVTDLLFSDPLTPESQKSFDRGLKSKNLGDGTTIELEKYHAYNTALHLYEKTWTKHPLPKVDDALAATTVGPRVTNIQKVLSNLNNAFAGSNVKFGVTLESQRSVDAGMINLPDEELNKLVGAPPLQTALNEVLTVAKVISIVTIKNEDGTETQELDGSLFMANLPKVMEQVINWTTSTDEKLTRPVGKVVPISTDPAKVRVPRAPGANPVGGPKHFYDMGAVISVPSNSSSILKGKRLEMLAAMTDGMTVSDYYRVAASFAWGGFNKGAARDLLEIMVNRGIVSVV